MKTQVIKNIIMKLLKGEDYRIEVIHLINMQFLQFAIEFFKDIVNAKLKNKDITVDWYKESFLSPALSTKDIAVHSGLNKKTIHNMFNSSTREIVINASNRHYNLLYESVKKLVDTEHDLDLTLTIKLKGVSVDLNVNESLIVINALAVKRAELRGSLWSTAGKRVEQPLMQTLCRLYGVSQKYYKSKIKKKSTKKTDFERETDFYLLKNKNRYKCEIKLMGRGNPESADVVIARDSKIFIADKLSNTNKKQLDKLKIEWVELRSRYGFKKFETILSKLEIPYTKLDNNQIDKKLEKIFKEVFKFSP